MQVLSEPELLAALNAAPGVKVTRSTFKQSLRPLFILRGEAQQLGAGNRATWVYDATRLNEWREYLAVRAELIRRGEWSTKRPYDWEEMEGIVQGNAHADVLAELFPTQDGAGEGEGEA
jgi:hypothetical protein